jgi:prepilin-type N-terminal cleavage/methylation domain-containing protein
VTRAREPRTRLADDQAFTLIELLTVLAILGIVLSALTTMFLSGTNAEREMNVRFQAQQNARTALSKLRREVRCAESAMTAASVVTLTMGSTCKVAQGTITWSTVALGTSRYGLFRCPGVSCGASGMKWGDYLTSASLFSYLAPTGTTSLPDLVTIATPSSAAGAYQAAGAKFGPPPTATAIAGQVVLVNDGSAAPTLGCRPLVGFPSGAIALVARGSCPFVQKVLIAQGAGAVAAIVTNNVAGAPFTMGGSDPSIAIPAAMVSLSDGNAIKNGLPATAGVTGGPVPDRTRPRLGVSLSVDLEPARPGGSYTLEDAIAFRNWGGLPTS